MTGVRAALPGREAALQRTAMAARFIMACSIARNCGCLPDANLLGNVTNYG